MRDPDQRVLSLRLSEELLSEEAAGVLSGAYLMVVSAACRAPSGGAAAEVTASTKKERFLTAWPRYPRQHSPLIKGELRPASPRPCVIYHPTQPPPRQGTAAAQPPAPGHPNKTFSKGKNSPWRKSSDLGLLLDAPGRQCWCLPAQTANTRLFRAHKRAAMGGRRWAPDWR